VVFAITGIGGFVVTLDLSIVNNAFAEMAASYDDVSRAALSWVVTGYNIMFASLLVVGGRTADRLGRKRVFMAGLVVFLVGSVVCGAAPTVPILIAGRVVQGIGGAFLAPATLGLLLGAFPPERRTQAVSLWGGVSALGVATGPTLGALLIATAGWRSAFYINVPICGLALVWGHRVLVETPRQHGRRPDLLGAAMLTVSLAALALGLSQGGDWGWSDPVVVAALITPVVLMPLFIRRSARHPEPVVDLGLFRNRRFALANVAGLLFGIGFAASILGNVLFLRTVWDYSVLEAGLATVVAPIVVAAVSGPAGRAANRLGFRRVLVAGPLIYAAGISLYLLFAGAEPDFLTDWLPASIVLGIGVGCSFPVVSAAAVSTLPPDRFAVGSAVSNTSRQVGSVIGVALLIGVLGDPSTPAANLAAARRGWMLSIIAGLGAALVSAFQPAGHRATDVAADGSTTEASRMAVSAAGPATGAGRVQSSPLSSSSST
jgi:EmrB/QacA subfamily drug resistance transporter